jgi:hypothetical protein
LRLRRPKLGALSIELWAARWKTQPLAGGDVSCLLDLNLMDILSSLGAGVNDGNMELAFLVRLAAFARDGARLRENWKGPSPGPKLAVH